MAISSRPLSPHLQIYRRTYTMVLSITHRATGLALSAGLGVLVAWLVVIASGPPAYEAFQGWLDSASGLVLIALLVVSFWYHFCCGIRHLIADTGRGLERRAARVSGLLVVIATTALSLLTVGLMLVRVGSSH